MFNLKSQKNRPQTLPEYKSFYAKYRRRKVASVTRLQKSFTKAHLENSVDVASIECHWCHTVRGKITQHALKLTDQ